MGHYSSYILLVVPALLLSLAAQIWVKSAYSRYSKRAARNGLTGARAAEAVLRYYGVPDVSIAMTNGKLTDNFNPSTKIISLSEGVFNSCSIAAIGIAAHEAGHAAQHAEGYTPIRVRNSILPVCKIGSYAGIPLAILGYFLSFEPLVFIGLGLYSFIAIFQLATLPVEFNASSRALHVIRETGLLFEDEVPGAKKVLTAAASTYVASLAVTMANLLRFLVIFTGRRR